VGLWTGKSWLRIETGHDVLVTTVGTRDTMIATSAYSFYKLPIDRSSVSCP